MHTYVISYTHEMFVCIHAKKNRSAKKKLEKKNKIVISYLIMRVKFIILYTETIMKEIYAHNAQQRKKRERERYEMCMQDKFS